MTAPIAAAGFAVPLGHAFPFFAVGDNGFVQLPLTQEDIGDATGLTSVHVNRMMRALVDDRIIERNGGNQLRLLDEKRLVSDSNYIDRTGLEAGWLPGAR